ncbi:MAG: methyltransferase domain-containing protein [Clostridia bacterium]|nr:methyltransferase domain-containing protein [Clostridia bacterium]
MSIPKNLICPLCAMPLSQKERSLCCSGEKIHCYDMAASGYVNLLPPGKMNNAKTGDGKEMLRARVNFLSGGYYDIISNTVASLIDENIPKEKITVLDAGCGEGYHLCNIASNLMKSKKVSAIGIDASKHGADMGAKTARFKKLPAYFAAGNIFSMPISEKSCDAVVSMFAPIPAGEAARVLCDDGVLVVVASGVHHLWEMRSVIYDQPRENTKGIKCPEGFVLCSETKVKEKVSLPDNETIMNLFTMTPFYHRCPKDGRERLEKTESLDVTVEAIIHVYKKA